MTTITKDNNKWIYIVFSIIIFMCMGTIYSWSVFRTAVEINFNIGATESAIPYILFLLCDSIGIFAAGNYIDKYGAKIIIIIGGILISLGWFLASYSSSILVLSLSYGIIAGLGNGIAYGGPIAITAKNFPKNKGLAVGLSLSGFGLSPFITAPTANYLIQKFGVMSTFRILALVFAVIIIPLASFLKVPTKKEDFLDRNKKNVEKLKKDNNQILKSKKFYIIWFLFLVASIIGLTAIAISAPAAKEIFNINSETAAFYIAIFAIFNGIGRPFFGFLSDKLKIRKTVVISFSLIIFASILMIMNNTANQMLFVIAFAIFWLNLGGWLAIAPAAVSHLFDSNNYSKNYGYLSTAYGVGALIGNIYSGRIRDLSGSYQAVFYPTLIIAVIALMISIIFLKNE